jgi:pantoate kinase
MAGEAVSAFVPGHVTGFFAVHEAEDPMQAGSTGGGLTLADGVRVTVRYGDRETYLDDASAPIAPVERVREALDVDATVIVESGLPPGCGFGVSGAAALGTALAAAESFELEHSANELVSLAHGAEVTSGTGLGDVVAQARGGIVLRTEPGAPGEGAFDGIPARETVEYIAMGELSTADVLGGDTDELSEIGQQCLQLVRSEPTVETFAQASRRFAREAELLTPDVRDAIQAANEAGGDASMAMLGKTVFCFGTGLTDAGYDAERTEIDPAGASLLR